MSYASAISTVDSQGVSFVHAMLTRGNLVALGLFSSVLGYLIYFDYRKNRRSKEQLPGHLLEDIHQKSPQEREQILYGLLFRGHELARSGDAHIEEASQIFYKAVQMVPNPKYLLDNLESTLPRPYFSGLTSLIAQETNKRTSEYFCRLAPTDLVEFRPRHLLLSSGEVETVWGMYATEDIDENQLIYQESPDVSILDLHLDPAQHCGYCFGTQFTTEFACSGCGQWYCSNDCRDKDSEYHFSQCLEPKTSGLIRLSRSNNTRYGMLVAKYLSILLSEEYRIMNSGQSESGMFSHYEFLVMIKLPVLPMDVEEGTLIRKILSGGKFKGIDEFITDSRYVSVKGALMYNSIAFTIEGTTVSAPRPFEQTEFAHMIGLETFRHHEKEFSGIGLYHVSAHIQHSCQPNIKLENRENNHKIFVVASKPIRKDEEITMSFIPIEPNMSAKDRARLLRDRYNLACSCCLCQIQAKIE